MSANQGDAQSVVQLVRMDDALKEPEKPLGYAKLKLRKPKRLIYPKVPRGLAGVYPAVCDLFGSLVAGKACWPFFVYGPVGGGKTYAGLTFCDLVEHSHFATLEGECSAVMKGGSVLRDHSDGLNRMIVLDEIGERSVNGDLHYTVLKGLLDDREYNHEKVGVYLSNLSPAELVKMFDDRMVSRLTAGTVFKLEGKDRRG